MEKYGEDPAVKAPPKKDAPASDSNTEAPKKKIMDPKKQALLEKRKKYDPRAAIKNSKKNTLIDPTSTIEQQATTSTIAIEEKPLVPGEQPPLELEDGEEAPKNPNVPARPFLKRKTKAVKIDKAQTKIKPQGKSKIDCWQKGGEQPNTTYIVGGKTKTGSKPHRQSLLKRNQ
jgi:hypothetical protein